MDVVARRPAEAEEGGRDARPEVMAEDRDHSRLSVRALSRAVDVPEATNRVRNAVSLAPGHDVRFASPFRSAVWRERRWEGGLRSRDDGTVAVQRAPGRRKDDRGAVA